MTKQDLKRFDNPIYANKIKGVELIFENCESIILPSNVIEDIKISNITKDLNFWKDYIGKTFIETNCKTADSIFILIHSSQNIKIKSSMSSTREVGGEKHTLEEFLDRKNISSIRFVYDFPINGKPTECFSYCINVKWEDADEYGYTNKLQKWVKTDVGDNTPSNLITLYLGNIAKEKTHETD